MSCSGSITLVQFPIIPLIVPRTCERIIKWTFRNKPPNQLYRCGEYVGTKKGKERTMNNIYLSSNAEHIQLAIKYMVQHSETYAQVFEIPL